MWKRKTFKTEKAAQLYPSCMYCRELKKGYYTLTMLARARNVTIDQLLRHKTVFICADENGEFFFNTNDN